jgi:hypothetical protein
MTPRSSVPDVSLGSVGTPVCDVIPVDVVSQLRKALQDPLVIRELSGVRFGTITFEIRDGEVYKVGVSRTHLL